MVLAHPINWKQNELPSCRYVLSSFDSTCRNFREDPAASSWQRKNDLRIVLQLLNLDYAPREKPPFFLRLLEPFCERYSLPMI